jgi:hypothetical protein
MRASFRGTSVSQPMLDPVRFRAVSDAQQLSPGTERAARAISYLAGIRAAKYSTSWEAAGGSRLLRLTTT